MFRAILVACLIPALCACGGGGGGGSSSPPPPSPLKFTNFQPASVVIGQPDFVSNAVNQSGAAGANTLNMLFGRAAAGSLYVPDSTNNRILGFNSVPTANNANADFVMGQVDFTTTVKNSGASDLNDPEDAFTAGGKLFVADTSNNRVLIWNSLPTSNTPADIVVGQSDFGFTTTTPVSNTSMSIPESVAAAGGKLFVADSGNNRVLIYNTIPTASGAAADVVLGQGDFTHTTANDDNQDGVVDATPTARTLDFPEGIWSDGTRLVVADEVNSRVLVWKSIPTVNDQPADLVIGATDFVGTYPSDPAANLDEPSTIFVLNNQLFIADQVDRRVLIFNHFPTANGASADVVLGQGDFTHYTANDDNQDGVEDANPTARTLSFVNGVFAAGKKLFVTDRGNNRLLIYDAQ